jgi:myo-inositol-1(or 4)-monophosphatase
VTQQSQLLEGHPRFHELATAISIAKDAGELLAAHFAHGEPATRAKAYLDVVTAADTEAERLIASRLRASFPQDAIVGEEGTAYNPITEAHPTKRVWYVDPLDGTFNFSRGIPFWCTSIGLVEAGRAVLGVVFDPIRNELFTAVGDAGCHLNGRPIRARRTEDPMEATVQLSINFHRDVIERSIADFNSIARGVMRTRNLGALALELAYVGAGRLDAVAQRGSHAWDYAAGVLIAREAAATISDLSGAEFDLHADNALVACSPQLHAALRHMINE